MGPRLWFSGRALAYQVYGSRFNPQNQKKMTNEQASSQDGRFIVNY